MLASLPSCACCSSSPKISHRFARCDFRGPHYCGTLIINGRKFTLFPKAVGMRLLGGAFSGYARGWFLTMPYRALLASASASPPCSRKSRFAAIFRESAVLYLFVIFTRASRITFLRQRTPFADTSAHGKGEAAALYNMRALKVAAARGKPLGFPLKIVEICFVSSKQISRVFIIPPARTVRHR